MSAMSMSPCRMRHVACVSALCARRAFRTSNVALVDGILLVLFILLLLLLLRLLRLLLLLLLPLEPPDR